jgi:hypothetical protein
MLLFVVTAVGIIVLVAVAVLNFVFCYNWAWLYRMSEFKKIDMIPGPKTVPLFGNILQFYGPETGAINCSQNLHFSNT